MGSTSLETKNGGDDDSSYTSPPRMMIVCDDENGGLSPPVLSITFPEPMAASIQEKVRSASTESFSSEWGCSSDEFVTGGASDGGVMSPNSSPNHVTSSVQNSMLQITRNSVCDESPASQVPKDESLFTTSAKPATETLQSLSDGSLLPALQVTGNASFSCSSSPKLSSMSSTSTPNHVIHSVQNCTNQISGDSVSEKSPASQESKVESPLTTSATPAATVSDSYPNHKHKESPRGGVGSQPNRGNGHHHQQNSYRRPNGRLHPRTDGFYYHNYGGNQAWNQNRNFTNRVTSMPPQRSGYYRGGYLQHSVHFSTPYIHSPMQMPVSTFSYNALYAAPAPPVFTVPSYLPAPNPFHEKIMKQIDYYFSSDNLAKDPYLRRHMDEQGWVSVDLVASFNKVSSLTSNAKLILDVMQKSNVVEVQGGKMRRRNDWMKWPLPLTVEYPVESQLRGIRMQ